MGLCVGFNSFMYIMYASGGADAYVFISGISHLSSSPPVRPRRSQAIKSAVALGSDKVSALAGNRRVQHFLDTDISLGFLHV